MSIMLTADAFGVLPPISRLTPIQAMYHFLSGFTAKVAGTEKGLGKEPQPTFSTCFGAPFMPRHPSEYGNLLRDLIAEHQADCWLVNTGWTGGAFGTGRAHADQGDARVAGRGARRHLANVEMRIDPHFRFRVPVAVPGVDAQDPQSARHLGRQGGLRRRRRRKLVAMFRENFRKFESPCRRRRTAGRTGSRRSRGVKPQRQGAIESSDPCNLSKKRNTRDTPLKH